MIRSLFLIFLLLGNITLAQVDTTGVVDTIPVPNAPGIYIPEEGTILPVKTTKGWQLMDPATRTIEMSKTYTEFQWPKSGVTDYFILKDEKYWGVLDLYKYELLPFIYDSIIHYEGSWLAKRDSIWEYHFLDEIVVLKADSFYRDDRYLYYFYEGKTGLFNMYQHISKPVHDFIHPFKCVSHSFDTEAYYLVKDGVNFNLLKDTSLYLPPDVVDVRCNDFGIFEFYRTRNIEYFFSSSGEILTPEGREVVIYNDSEYKIYDERGKTAEYHRQDGKVFKGTYDDYFPLTDRHMAVRQNGKVGLYDQLNNRLLTPIKYDQITLIGGEYEDDGTHFKFFIGESCGAMDGRGKELFEPIYSNILFSRSNKFFIVINDERTGVVKRNGEVVLPASYDYIQYYPRTKFFVVQDKRKYGIFKSNGEELIPIDYAKHRYEVDYSSEISGAIHVLGNGKNMFFVGQMGMLDGKPYTHYEITKDVIKAYGADAITVFLLDKNGNVEEKQTYRGIPSVVVSKNSTSIYDSYRHWPTSYLEENQLTGKFGLRWFQKNGLGVNPNYRNIRRAHFSRFLGETPHKSSNAPFLKEFNISILRSYNELVTDVGRMVNHNIYNSELVQVSHGSTHKIMHHKTDFSQSIDHNGNSELISEEFLKTHRVHYSDILQHSLKRYYIGGEAEICDIDTADVSLFDYYMYWNMTSACRLPAEKMSLVLNPKTGVKFNGAEQKVFELSNPGERKGIVRYDVISDFDDFQTYHGNFIYELRGSNGRLLKYRYDEKGENSLNQVLDPEMVFTESGTAVIAVIKGKVQGMIHKEYPTFNFVNSDNRIDYHSGRIIERIDSVYTRLVTPDDEIIIDSARRIIYLKEDFFGIYDSLGVQVIHSSGRKLRPEHYLSATEFSHGRIQLRDSSGYNHIVDTTGKILKSSRDSFRDLDARKYIDRSNESVIYDRITGKTDTLKKGERYYGHGFITKRVDDGYSIRSFGNQQSIDVEMSGKLKYFGNRFYYQLKKHFYTIDSNLVKERFKKMSKFETIAPNTGWLEGKKLTFLLDTNWNTLYSINENESFKMVGDRPMIRTGGRLVPVHKTEKDTLSEKFQENLPMLEIFEKEGLFGLQRDSIVVQSAVYESISPKSKDEFYTVLSMRKKVFTDELNPLFEFPFDTFVQTYNGDVLVRYNGEVMVYNSDGERIY